MSSMYVEKLIKTVILNSHSNNWEQAVTEWDIIDCEEDIEMQGACVCGKENLKYLYTIKNRITGNILFPIGSSCIRKFEQSNLNHEINIREGMFKLYRALQNNERIELSSEYFTRSLLLALYEDGAFDTAYNKYDGEGDFAFMLKLFNNRNKDSISFAQWKKVNAIVAFSIKPYLRRNLKFSDR